MTDMVPLSQRRRRPRLEEKAVRRLMFEAARGLIIKHRLLAASLEDLGMEDVIKQADVPRASVYRIWPYKADFIGDLLVQLARPSWFGTGAFDDETLRSAAAVLLEHYDVLTDPRSTIDQRRAVTREAMRVGATRNFEYLCISEAWRVYTALSATASAISPEETRRELALALQESDWTFTHTMAFFYQQMGEFVGYRLSDPAYSYTQVAAAGAAAVEGLGLRYQFGIAALSDQETSSKTIGDDEPAWQGSIRRLLGAEVPGPGLDGKPVGWSLAAFAFRSIFEGFVTFLAPEDFRPRPKEELLELLASLDAIKDATGIFDLGRLQAVAGAADAVVDTPCS